MDGEPLEVASAEQIFNGAGIDYDYNTISLAECVIRSALRMHAGPT